MSKYFGWVLRSLRFARRHFVPVCIIATVMQLHPGPAFAAPPLRLGWQIPWATQGQLVMGLKYTNIPELTGIDLDYSGFSYGGPLNRAALSGEVDILLTADQPALVLTSRSKDFDIVARMMYNRVCLYVPPKSPVRTLGDLRGRTIMGPVGAAAERVAMAEIARAGVALSEINAGSLDMSQQSALLRTGSQGEKWRNIDALYGFDPLPAVFETAGQARMLHCGKVVSVVVASKELIQKRPEQLRSFLRAFALSWAYFATKPQLVNRWFSEESKLNVGDDVLDKAASIEPNRWVKNVSQIRLRFNQEDLEVLDEALSFLLSRKIVKTKHDFKSRIDLQPLMKALEDFDLQNELGKVIARK